MKENKEVNISYWAAHMTTVVSVTLVLILVGIIALITISAEKETERIKEKLELSVIMADSVSDAGAASLAAKIGLNPYVHDIHVITREEALKAWKEETGEDLEALFGVNPLSPEISFTVNAAYASAQSITGIERELSGLPGVEGIAVPDSEIMESMNRNIERLSIILGIIALVMIVISFVLINNTVHLTVYARRFTIHTMQLVGATDGFIRAPFIKNNMVSGLLAGLLASAIMAISLAVAPRAGFDDVAYYISWPLYAAVAGGMIVTGVILCGIAAGVATSRYLSKDYEELFR